jgi:hypothetical protein
MLETCRDPWFPLNWMKSASRWFHYTDTDTTSYLQADLHSWVKNARQISNTLFSDI